ncbi:MAG: hypothetical protein CSA26_06005 [Desulfobacterales bacterium]|nr:MAG: hypothetical protein CSA26_06005 [Desulfobacterales bacterium]
MRHILNELITRLREKETVVIAGIIKAGGSVPRTSGARMLVTENGELYGSVGGGVVEGACHARARRMLQEKEPFSFIEQTLQPSAAADAGMICGGQVTILLQRLDADSLELFTHLQQDYRQGKRPVLLTFLMKEGAPHITSLAYDPAGLVDDELRTILSATPGREPFLTTAAETRLLVEPLCHPGVVHLVGAGHVAEATAHLAAYAGFEVVVMDDREAFANRERFPEATEIKKLPNFDACITDLGPDDYVVIVTRGHLYDRDVLAQALKTEAGYIGMIGSRKKRQAVYDSLMKEGVSREQLEKVFSPIGLSIGADTPREIGFSIVSEMIQVRAGKTR